MRLLIPEPARDISVPELMAELRPADDPPPDRPYLMTNFALTLDGRATIGGVSGPIGSDRDTELLVGLRTRADAVMIGAGTMRAERYGRVVRDPAKRARREDEGLAADPLMVIVSGRLDLPWDAPLFEEGAGEVVIFTASESEAPETATPTHVVRHGPGVDLAGAMAYLRHERGVRSLLCEGGPHLHAELLTLGLVDELFVTHAPKLTGGEGPRLVAGLPEAERPVELIWLAAEPELGELYGRYRVTATQE
ncbi:MAG: dihydrofolate reductase family protein [Actinomycetota bacterium]|nr:dihydrofolate reductase family protein [Actinomycetota bacterium]